MCWSKTEAPQTHPQVAQVYAQPQQVNQPPMGYYPQPGVVNQPPPPMGYYPQPGVSQPPMGYAQPMMQQPAPAPQQQQPQGFKEHAKAAAPGLLMSLASTCCAMCTGRCLGCKDKDNTDSDSDDDNKGKAKKQDVRPPTVPSKQKSESPKIKETEKAAKKDDSDSDDNNSDNESREHHPPRES